MVYAEVAAGPRYWPHVPYAELLPALCAGFDRAQRDGLADCRLLPTISRDQPAAWALELVDWIAAAGLPRVVGLGLDGDESATGRTGPVFAPAFERARAHGLGTTAHAGESSGPEGVRDALDVLGVRRIDHGVRAIEDPALVERLARDGVTLNVCPTPNVALGLYPGLDDHPLGALIAAGVPVTLGSDDACVYDITLAGELTAMGGRLGWTLADVERITRQAIDVAFCDDARKAELRALVEAGYSNSVERRVVSRVARGDTRRGATAAPACDHPRPWTVRSWGPWKRAARRACAPSARGRTTSAPRTGFRRPGPTR